MALFVDDRRIRALVGRILPRQARGTMRDFWEDLRDWVEVFRFGLSFAARRVARPRTLLYFGFSPGDDLLCTAVLRELRKRGRDKLMMVTDHGELLLGNEDVTYLRPLWSRYKRDRSTAAICRRFSRIWGSEFVRLEYAPPEGKDRHRPPSRHIVAEMCARAGITGPVSIRPYLSLSDEEKSSACWARNVIGIQSSGTAARHPMKNKQWYQERFQGVVDALKGEAEFIQLGSIGDPPLQNVTDLRGATSTRQTAAILYHARLYVGGVGFLMHLARAAECPSVIIYGGREAPWQSGYICNTNLFSAVPCAPCWRANTCDFDRRCMQSISIDDVVSAVRKMMAMPRGPLAVETVEISPAIPERSC